MERRDVLKGVTAAGLGGLGLSSMGSAAGHPTPNEIAVRAVEVPVRYEIVVSGEIRKGPKAGGTDRILDGRIARGFIDTVGEVDDYRFSGEIQAFTVEGAVETFVNGQQVEDPVGLPTKDLPNAITIQARGPGARYQFAVTGRVEKGSQADANDEIRGRSVRGSVGGSGADDFRYSGNLTFASGDEPLRVVLDLNRN